MRRLFCCCLKPQGAGFPEHLLKGAVEVVSHDGVGRADKLPPDEHSRDRGVATQASKGPLNFLSPGVLVHLVDGWADPELVEEPLHRMAHAAAALAEYHDRPLRRQLRHPVHDAKIWKAYGVSKSNVMVVMAGD
ncbi:hypothetical protein MLD38_038862 [Melastoma candidum]|uniref:Uncharacterized protein n=1 Tax=Melastoma candidum TaxID=119954 RepID=A0ACB9L1G3_9MYRT|nr:hypothetical protein MLD38_038862 [Melastoma candidum]